MMGANVVTRSRFGSTTVRGIISAVLLVGLHGSARAIVINDTAGSAQAIALGSTQSSVVELFLGGFLCTGTLIDSTHVITAQHCTFGIDPGDITVNFDSNGDGSPEETRSVSGKIEPDGVDDFLDGSDIAILTLSSAAPGFAAPVEFLALNPTGAIAATVGYGVNGLGSVGHDGTRDGQRWAALNMIDSLGPALSSNGVPIGGTANILNTDFDDGTALNNKLSTVGSSPTPLDDEGTTAPGDSGGPLLVDGRIVGVLSGGTTADSVYGDVSWWTGTTFWQSFIEESAPGAVFVPEPSAFGLAAIGLLGLGVLWRRQRRRIETD